MFRVPHFLLKQNLNLNLVRFPKSHYPAILGLSSSPQFPTHVFMIVYKTQPNIEHLIRIDVLFVVAQCSALL